MPAPPSGQARFEHDLHEIRESRDISLSDVQQETRIPVDVLERFEAGGLVEDPHYNEVYLKALLRSYASAIGLSPQEVVSAYEAEKAGSYRGALRQHLGETPPPAEPSPRAAEAPPEEPPPATPPQAEPPPATPPPSEAPPRGQTPAPAVAALRKSPPTKSTSSPAPRIESKSRVVSRHQASSTTTPIDRSWGLLIGAAAIGVLLIAGALWFLLRGGDSPEPVDRPRPVAQAPDTTAGAEEDTLAAAPGAATGGAVGDAPRLQTPITVTVVAEGGPLQNFRVTEEPDSRRPYWIEQGDEETFQSDQQVTVWGTESGGSYGIPSAARLRLQGYTWAPTGEVVRIDRERGQALLDSLHRAQGGAPTP